MKQIVIIGAGLGGLTSAALLSKRGYRVTVLEQHYMAGGCATTFKRPGGFRCEVGLHEMDGVYSSKTVRGVFETLDVYDHMSFVEPKEFFRHQSETLLFDMPNRREKAIEKLVTHYPDEEEGIRRYFEIIKTIHDKIEQIQHASWWEYALFPLLYYPIFKYRRVSVKKVMDKLFHNEELKLLLNTNVQYYNDSISEFSFLYHAIAQHSFFNGGGHFIKGGSQILSDYLVSVIEKHGGEVILRADVKRMETERGRIHSVIYTHKKEEKEIAADLVISNISPAQTYTMAGVAYKERLKTATSLLTLYIGFKENIREYYGMRPYTTFFFNGISSIEAHDASIPSISEREFIFTDYSQIDAGLTPEDRSFGVICAVDKLAAWEGLSQKEYKEKKARITEMYLQRLEEHYPDIRTHIAFTELATARTMQHYLKTPNGTPYGFAPTARQVFRIPRTKSKQLGNLYHVGAWVVGGGFSAAIISADMCYRQVCVRETL